jgi:O-antigen ligase
MPTTQRWTKRGELACLALFFCWLVFLPLPFGSVVPAARLPLIAVPLALCTVAALVRLYATRDRTNTAQPTRAWLISGSGALLFLGVIALQLVPLPRGVLRLLSPESESIWSAASRLIALAGGTPRAYWPVSVDPAATKLELFRMGALLAAFATAAMLIRTHARRQVLAFAIGAAAVFEVLYGIREAALKRYAIWGWVNKLIFDRVTGTFVNPNHFAHYLAIALPMGLFVAAVLWHRAGGSETPLVRRFLAVLEAAIIRFGLAIAAVIACIAGILLSQSRGGLLSLGAGLFLVAAMLPGRRIARISFGAVAGVIAIVAITLFFGPERTVRRFGESDDSLAGRRIGIAAAHGVWQRFPLLGSGAGTFERVVSLEQQGDPTKMFHHAHNDYAEIAATTGAVGFTVAMVALLGGYGTLVRMTFGAQRGEISWSRRAFQAAALASLSIAMIHALIDFNFFIPANPATLAAIAGAAVASLDHDRRTRR